MAVDPASYRDPAGQVLLVDGRVLRKVRPAGLDDYRFVRDSGALTPLVAEGRVIDSKETDPSLLGAEAPEGGVVLEHPKIPFWSYPYEWPFEALKAAALCHLDIQIALLERGIALSDASAYNIQFLGPRPQFIDTLSFRRYRENEHWWGHRQFCEQFLNPLLLEAIFGVAFQDWYRGRLEGIPTVSLARLARWRHYLSWRLLGHVILPSRLQGGSGEGRLDAAVRAKARGIPKRSYLATLAQLRSWIAGLSPRGREKSTWGDYARRNTYEDAAHAKRSAVADFAKAVRPKLLLDLGCNTGDYAALALESGAAAVVGIDADHVALGRAYARARDRALNFLPLYQDSANPSPGQGWQGLERPGLAERCRGVDAVIALAFEHHLAIGRNIGLADVVGWIVGLAPRGLIEFVRKDDPMVQRMLALRDDIFPDYTVENFAEALARQARIVRREEVSRSKREMFWFERPHAP